MKAWQVIGWTGVGLIVVVLAAIGTIVVVETIRYIRGNRNIFGGK